MLQQETILMAESLSYVSIVFSTTTTNNNIHLDSAISSICAEHFKMKILLLDRQDTYGYMPEQTSMLPVCCLGPVDDFGQLCMHPTFIPNRRHTHTDKY